MVSSHKFLYRLYPLFAFLLPLQTRWIVRDAPVGDSVWEYGRVSIYSFDVVLLLIVGIVVLTLLDSRIRPLHAHIREEGKRDKKNKVFVILLNAFAAGLFVGYELLVSLDPFLTAVVLIRVFLFSIAGWYLVRQHHTIILRKMLGAFVFAMVISAGFGTIQFFAQDALYASKWLGLHGHDATVSGTSVVEAQGGRWLRAHGTMPHPNILGGFSAIALVLFFYLLVVRDFQNNIPSPLTLRRKTLVTVQNIYVGVAPIVLLAGIVAAMSRAAIIAVMAGCITFVWQAHRHPRYQMLVPWIKGLAVAGLLMVIFIGPAAFTRLTAHGRLEMISFTRRIAAYGEAFTTIEYYGLTGTGLGAATAALRALYPHTMIWELQPVHNIPVLVLLELGLGGIVLLCFLFVLLNKFLVINFQFSNPLLICWTVLIVFDHYLWSLPSGLYLSILVFLCIHMSDGVGEMKKIDYFTEKL